jgi:hypothetical protein
MKLKNMSLKKKRKKANPNKPFKLELISKTLNQWNLRPKLNKETQFLTNLMLNDKIKKILIYKICQSKKHSNQNNGD